MDPIVACCQHPASLAGAELIVAWTGYAEKVLAARRLPAAELANQRDWFSRENSTATRDWFGLLGLVGSNGVTP
jgi:hypothetical protein